MWLVFAVLSSVFAALTSILAKIGIEGVNSNLATAVKTVVVVIMAWVVVFITNAQSGLSEISRRSFRCLSIGKHKMDEIDDILRERKKFPQAPFKYSCQGNLTTQP